MEKMRGFLEKHKIGTQGFGIAQNMPEYTKEMQLGLDGQPSSLLMIPTYIEKRLDFPANEPVICVDAGGTNLRVCRAVFDDKYKLEIEDLQRMSIPGADSEITAGAFFDQFARLLLPYCGKCNRIALSFAYRATASPDHDSQIIEITKEVKVKGSSGKWLAKEILAALKKLGVEKASMAVINDSVAVALSAIAETVGKGYSTYTGTVLGTGSNSCYFEQNQNIRKIPGLSPSGQMLINTEAGSYNKLPLSDLDRAFDATTLRPNIGVTEKLCSGGYLGALSEFMINAAAKEGALATRALAGPIGLTTPEISKFLENPVPVLGRTPLESADIQPLNELLSVIRDRGAYAVALQISGMISKNPPREGGKICAAIEGSTYEKLFGTKELICRLLKEYWESFGDEISILTPANPVLKGCAIASLSAFPVCV